MSKKVTENEVKIETLEEFEGAVDLAAAKQDEIKRLKAKVDAAKKTLETAKKVLSLYMDPSERYALDNESEIFPDPEHEERQTEASVYGLKQNANPSVVIDEGMKDEDVIAKIERSRTLKEELKDAFVVREPKLSRQQIIAAHKSGQVDDKQLKRLGLAVRKVKSLYVQSKAA